MPGAVALHHLPARPGAPWPGVLGIALVAEGGGAGTWARIDSAGRPLTDPAYAMGGSAYADHPVWGGMIAETLDGQSLVRLPAFHGRVAPAPPGSPLAGRPCWWVGADPFPGSRLHPAFCRTSGPLSHIWIGRYQAGLDDAGRLASRPGVMPAASRSVATFAALAAAQAAATGRRLRLWSIQDLAALRLLALIEMGGPDSQTLIGPGRVTADTPDPAPVDAADVATASYRGLVGLWGNLWQIVDGLRRGADGGWWLRDPIDAASWTATGVPLPGNGWPRRLALARGPGFDLRPLLLPENTASTADDGSLGDHVYHPVGLVGERLVCVGGFWGLSDLAGLFYLGVSARPGDALPSLGTRIACDPG